MGSCIGKINLSKSLVDSHIGQLHELKKSIKNTHINFGNSIALDMSDIRITVNDQIPNGSFRKVKKSNIFNEK